LIGKELAEFIKNDTQYETYFEPFCGMLGVGRHMNFDTIILNDIHKDLMLLLKDLYYKTFVFPTVDEDRYERLKKSAPSPQRGYAGFLLSYGGKWFGGFSSKYGERDFHKEAEIGCKKLQADLQDKTICFENKSFEEFEPYHMCVYADPPYENTTGYGVRFDHNKFWNIMRRWSVTNDVYISSYDAPNDFECVWEKPKRMTLSNDKSIITHERLFKLKTPKDKSV